MCSSIEQKRNNSLDLRNFREIWFPHYEKLLEDILPQIMRKFSLNK